VPTLGACSPHLFSLLCLQSQGAGRRERRNLASSKHLGQKVSQNSVCNRPNPWYNRRMKANDKSNEIDAMLTSVFGVDRVKTISGGTCVSCDAEGIIATSFSDDISRKEYSISGLCQSCQDDVFGHDDLDPDECEDWDDEDAFTSAGWGTDESYL